MTTVTDALLTVDRYSTCCEPTGRALAEGKKMDLRPSIAVFVFAAAFFAVAALVAG